jgi:MinD superfamily P-loop ATPase
MIISIASGKGGTGKTTVAVNLAFALGKGVQLLDCDVEEPNAHLFVKPSIDHTETAYTPVPEIDESKCTYCRKCADICRFKAIAVAGKVILVFAELCHSCGGCWTVCPENAIAETRRELGIIERGSRKGVQFIHGRLRVGEAMSPPLINKVREHIKPDLINIIDAPPGTSCPVIAAIKNADFVLMVTEPTPFGLHDLKLGVEAVRLLGMPCGLVINRSDIGTHDVRNYAEKEKLPILMEIPFDRGIAEVYSRGDLIIDQLPEWKPRFRDLYAGILRLIDRGSDT